MSTVGERHEDWRGEEYVVRGVTALGAAKAYRCPGCDQEIRPACRTSGRLAGVRRCRQRPPALAQHLLGGARSTRSRRAAQPLRPALLTGLVGGDGAAPGGGGSRPGSAPAWRPGCGAALADAGAPRRAGRAGGGPRWSPRRRSRVRRPAPARASGPPRRRRRPAARRRQRSRRCVGGAASVRSPRQPECGERGPRRRADRVRPGPRHPGAPAWLPIPRSPGPLRSGPARCSAPALPRRRRGAVRLQRGDDGRCRRHRRGAG